jgi:hypothetical protein
MVFVCALQAQEALSSGNGPDIPTEILVPAGNTVFLKTHAVGTQNYICQQAGSSFAWKFLGPQATLFTANRNNFLYARQVTTHFLSANPMEGGVHRPTWQSSSDTSAVWGKVAASSTDPAYVAPGAIPWLLVQIVGAQNGPTGGSSLTVATYIHRVNTVGGVAPSTGCSEPGNIGAVALVPYTTDYYFYKSN